MKSISVFVSFLSFLCVINADAGDNSKISYHATLSDSKVIDPSSIVVHTALTNNTSDTIVYYIHLCYNPQYFVTDTSIIYNNIAVQCSHDGVLRCTLAPCNTFIGEVSLASDATADKLHGLKFRVGFNFLSEDLFNSTPSPPNSTRKMYMPTLREMTDMKNMIWSNAIEIE